MKLLSPLKAPPSSLPKTAFGEMAGGPGARLKRCPQTTFQELRSVPGVTRPNHSGAGTRTRFRGPSLGSRARLRPSSHELAGEGLQASCRRGVLRRGVRGERQFVPATSRGHGIAFESPLALDRRALNSRLTWPPVPSATFFFPWGTRTFLPVLKKSVLLNRGDTYVTFIVAAVSRAQPGGACTHPEVRAGLPTLGLVRFFVLRN